MKRILGIISTLIALAVIAQVSADALAAKHVKEMREDGSITNVVNLLISSGEFCRVHGHAWGPHLHVTLEYMPDRISCRECKVCGLHQSQYVTDWK